MEQKVFISIPLPTTTTTEKNSIYFLNNNRNNMEIVIKRTHRICVHPTYFLVDEDDVCYIARVKLRATFLLIIRSFFLFLQLYLIFSPNRYNSDDVELMNNAIHSLSLLLADLFNEEAHITPLTHYESYLVIN